MHITPISESALVCALSPPASLPQQQKLWAFADALSHHEKVKDVVMGMNNLTVFTDYLSDFTPLITQLKACWHQLKEETFDAKTIEIPVIYDGEDLENVAKFHRTTIEHIIEMHTAPLYTVYMIGFQPGFPYLGGLPENLHTPRRTTPRTLVPAGSVGIGGSQTGVYPFASPGGWQLIGRTNLPLFDKNRSSPTLLQAGDNVKFVVEKVVV